MSVTEPWETVARAVAARGYGARVLLDTDGRVTEAYRVQVTPTVYLIGRDGMLLGRAVGRSQTMGQAAWACASRGTASPVISLATKRATGNRVPPDCAALLLAGLLVAYGATRRIGTDRARVKVTDVLEHSLGLAISPATAATILRRDLKLTVIRLGGKQNYVVGSTPAAIRVLWARIR